MRSTDWANEDYEILHKLDAQDLFGGHGSAVNAGLANATGLFFKVVDSDDWVKEDAYDAIMDQLRELVKTLINNCVWLQNSWRCQLLMGIAPATSDDKQ